MKRMRLLKAGMIVLACVGLLIPSPILQAAAPDSGSRQEAQGRTPAVIDGALYDGGILHGQVVDAHGKPLAGTAVSIQQLDREIATAVTDASGHFQVAGLRGGTYRIVAGEATGVYRLWAPHTAPPSARAGALLVSGDRQVLLGQYRGLELLRNPWVIAGLVAVAIAVPIAVHNANQDDGPQS